MCSAARSTTSPSTRRTSTAATSRNCWGLLADGRALPHISATYPLAEAAAALRHVADRKAIGKVVLEIA
jgi:NADPH:quinone reductase-like Zn-dependent oxidoreductase